MKYLICIIMMLIQYSIFSQAIELDSIDFYDQTKYEQKTNYTSIGKLKSISYDAITSNLRKIEFYNSNQRIAKYQILQDSLLREVKYTYLEKGQVTKKYDVLNKTDLPGEVNVFITYPALARENGIGGKVLVKFSYDESCIPIKFKILNSLGYGIDEEVNTKMKRLIGLAKKHKIHFQNCLDNEIPYVVHFRLK